MRLRTSLITLCAAVTIVGAPRAALAQLGGRPAAEWIKTLKNLARYMKPTGRIAIIDFIPGAGGHRDDAKMQLSADRVTGLMAQAGFNR